MRYHPTDVVSVFNRLTAPDVLSTVFLETDVRRVTYQDLTERTGKLASLFAQAGLHEGDRIVLSVSDDAETAILFLSLLRCGITAVLLDPETKADRAKAILRTAQPAGYIADEAFFEKMALNQAENFTLVVKPEIPSKGGLFRKLLGRHATATVPAATATDPSRLANLPAGTPPASVNPATIAYVLFTSGTTADPKGVQISHRALFAHLGTLSRVYGLSPDSRLLNILLLYHADGILQGPVLAAFNAARCVRPLTFDIARVGALLDAVYRHRITHFVAVPAMLALIHRFAEGMDDAFRTADFRALISVSSHLEESLWRAFSDRFGVRIANVYGLTETVAGGLFSGPTDDTYRLGTVGKPVDVEARIVNEAGHDQADGKEGELLLRGETLTSGYLNNPAATAALLQNGWLHTGDVALRSAEGFFQITGRLKNIIVTGGVNVHPEEVTEVLNLHPAVAESVSLGLPDEVFGERLVSCVVLKADHAATEADLTAWCRQRLEEKKVPTAVFRMAELPKGPSGKVRLDAVRDWLDGQTTAAAATPDFRALVFGAAARAFKVPVGQLKPEDTSRTLPGWDSLAHLDFIVDLERQLGVQFEPSDILVMNSLQTAEEQVRRKSPVHA